MVLQVMPLLYHGLIGGAACLGTLLFGAKKKKNIISFFLFPIAQGHEAAS